MPAYVFGYERAISRARRLPHFTPIGGRSLEDEAPEPVHGIASTFVPFDQAVLEEEGGKEERPSERKPFLPLQQLAGNVPLQHLRKGGGRKKKSRASTGLKSTAQKGSAVEADEALRFLFEELCLHESENMLDWNSPPSVSFTVKEDEDIILREEGKMLVEAVAAKVRSILIKYRFLFSEMKTELKRTAIETANAVELFQSVGVRMSRFREVETIAMDAQKLSVTLEGATTETERSLRCQIAFITEKAKDRDMDCAVVFEAMKTKCAELEEQVRILCVEAEEWEKEANAWFIEANVGLESNTTVNEHPSPPSQSRTDTGGLSPLSWASSQKESRDFVLSFADKIDEIDSQAQQGWSSDDNDLLFPALTSQEYHEDLNVESPQIEQPQEYGVTALIDLPSSPLTDEPLANSTRLCADIIRELTSSSSDTEIECYESVSAVPESPLLDEHLKVLMSLSQSGDVDDVESRATPSDAVEAAVECTSRQELPLTPPEEDNEKRPLGDTSRVCIYFILAFFSLFFGVGSIAMHPNHRRRACDSSLPKRFASALLVPVLRVAHGITHMLLLRLADVCDDSLDAADDDAMLSPT